MQDSSILNILNDQLYAMMSVIPALAKAIAVLVVGWILASLVSSLIKRLLSAIGIDKLAQKLMEIDIFRKSSISIVPSKIISGFVYYFILIIFSMVAVEAIGLPMLSELMQDLVNYLPNVVTACVLLLLGILLSDALRKLIYTTCSSLGISSGGLIANIVFYFILINVVLIALRQAKLQTAFMEDNISTLLAGVAGAFAIGYGLASKNIMSSLLSSFYSRGRVKIGDEITINGVRGEVINLSNNDLILRAEDSEFVVPFSMVSKLGVEIHSRRANGPALPPNKGKGPTGGGNGRTLKKG